MSGASVRILIEAEDQASKKVQETARAIETNIKSIKDVGKNAKSSTEFFGTLANALGGSELASYSSQLGQVSEKVSQFSEIQKLGGAGALAFKAGLSAVVGVLSYQVGAAIGNVIFQTEKWTKKLGEANAEAKKLAANAAKIQANQVSDRKEDIDLIQDPDAKRVAYEELFRDLNKNIMGVESAVASGRKEVEQWDAAWLKTGNRAAFADQAKNKLAEDRERLAVLQEQRLEVQKALGPRAAENAALREQNELKVKSDSYITGLREELTLLRAKKDEVASIQAAKSAMGEEAQAEATALLQEKERITAENASKSYIDGLREQLALLQATNEEKSGVAAAQKTVGADTAEATAILEKIELIKSLQEVEKENLAERESTAKRIASLKQSELDKLEEERILRSKGKEAAHAFNLRKQGLSEEDAQNIASQQAGLDNSKIKTDKAPELQAKESRLLTRGSVDESTKMTAVNTAQAAASLKAIEKAQLAQQKNGKQEFKFVLVQ